MEQLLALSPTWGPQASGGKYSIDIKRQCQGEPQEDVSPLTTHTHDHFLAPQDFRTENVLSL